MLNHSSVFEIPSIDLSLLQPLFDLMAKSEPLEQTHVELYLVMFFFQELIKVWVMVVVGLCFAVDNLKNKWWVYGFLRWMWLW